MNIVRGPGQYDKYWYRATLYHHHHHHHRTYIHILFNEAGRSEAYQGLVWTCRKNRHHHHHRSRRRH